MKKNRFKINLIAALVALASIIMLLPDWIIAEKIHLNFFTIFKTFNAPGEYYFPKIASTVEVFSLVLTIMAALAALLLLLYIFLALKDTRRAPAIGKLAFFISALTAFSAFLAVNRVNYALYSAGLKGQDTLALLMWPYIVFGLGLIMTFYYIPNTAPAKVDKKSGEEKPKIKVEAGTQRVSEETITKPKDTRSAIGKLLGFLRPYRARLLAAIGLLVLSTGLESVGPFILGKATDQLIKVFDGQIQIPAEFAAFIQIIVVLGFIYLSFSILDYISTFILAGVTEKALFDLRGKINNKLERLPLNYFDTTSYGDILSRVTNDVDTISNALQTSIMQIFRSITKGIVIFIMLLQISPTLSLIAVVVVPLSLLIMMVIVNKGKKYFAGQAKYMGDLNGYVEEMYEGHSNVSVYNKQKDVTREFEVINDELCKNGGKAQFIGSVLNPLTLALANIGYAIGAVASGYLVISGQMTIGMMQSFLQYQKEFSDPISQTAQISSIMQSTAAASERIFEFLEEKEEKADENDLFPQNPDGTVTFHNVSFGYSPDKILITDLSAKIEPGYKIAIVGPTGAGKTTLVNLLLRFYDINGGKICINGISINDMKRTRLRELFGMVLQDAWLYSGTVRENIRYGRLEATDEEVYSAAKSARCDDFIEKLPGGYDFVLAEGGRNIAQGQRQLLTIARAILSDPVILILDEATSSVDTRTEKAIQDAMLNLMQRRTSFVIAHRLSTIRDAQMILYMQDGDIREFGTHDEFIAKGELYASLYNSQFQHN